MFRVAAAFSVSAVKLTKPSLLFLRFLYTDRFLGLTSVHALQEEELLKLQKTRNLQNLKSRIISSADKGILLSKDMESLSMMAVGMNDIILYKNSIKRFIELSQASRISLLNAGPHIHKFCQLSHLLNAPDLARELFEDENVKNVILMNSRLASQSYLLLNNLLFKTGNFSHIIRLSTCLDLSKLENSYETHALLTLVLLALIKDPQPDGLAQATLLMSTYMGTENPLEQLSHGRGRLSNAFAWLACKEGEYAVAYEIVHAETNSSNRSLQTNLQLFTLLKLSKTEDVISVLGNFIQSMAGPERKDQQKPALCREVIQLLVADVKESNDEQMISNLKKIFSQLDRRAEITDVTIEDLLMMPVDSVDSAQRRRVNSMEEVGRTHKPRQQQY